MRQRIKEIDEMCNQRLEIGKKKYGEDAWITRNTFQDMIEELSDMINYAKFMIMKLNDMKEIVDTHQGTIQDLLKVCEKMKEDEPNPHSETKEA